ncbi:MAG: hypothetical protein IPJ51_22805 [Saprospiraceae bacterium]|jgi:hypothetical protein|nr:hypothetical protein [Saprospiraceae bacterium]
MVEVSARYGEDLSAPQRADKCNFDPIFSHVGLLTYGVKNLQFDIKNANESKH